MICKNCPEGRRHTAGSRYCILYGIYIRENHECIREGGRRHEGEEPPADEPEDSWSEIDRILTEGGPDDGTADEHF